jgi:hypothetical protein
MGAQTHSFKHWVSVTARRGLRRLRAAGPLRDESKRE